MSMLKHLGAQIQATSDELPLDQVAVAADRLRNAADLLMWVRRSSGSSLGVPELGDATEHLEQAGHALLAGQDSLAEYLAAIGLAHPPGEAPAPAAGRGRVPAPSAAAPDGGPAQRDAPTLRRWWTTRVNQLAEHDDPARDREQDRGSAARDSADLLRRAADKVRGGDRAGLRRELAGVDASVGLGMSALTAGVLRQLATDLLGRPPGPGDLGRLAGETRGRVAALLPRVTDETVDGLLARVCRVPPRSPSTTRHPVDTAVAGAVLAGILADRLGREPGSLTSGRDRHG